MRSPARMLDELDTDLDAMEDLIRRLPGSDSEKSQICQKLYEIYQMTEQMVDSAEAKK